MDKRSKANFRLLRRVVSLTAILGVLGVPIFLFAQMPKAKTDAEQISGLMAALSDRSKAPADVLDPNLSSPDRHKSLSHFSASRYEFSLVPTAEVSAITGDAASLPVRVHYKAEDGNSLNASTTAQFVRRNGTWYFANFDFMAWPAFLIIVLVVGVLVGIGYATTVLLLGNRLVRQRRFGGVNCVKMFLPFFWRGLFRQTR